MNATIARCLFVCMMLSLCAIEANAQSGEDPVLSPCYIKLKSENMIRIPAQEAGVLIEMPVREGSSVKAGQLLARIDDREAKATLKIAEYALESAEKRAAEDIEIRYSKKAEAVAKTDLEQDMIANRNQPGAIPEIEIRRKRLDWERATLQIEKAAKDQVLAVLEARTKEAERDAAQMALTWRTIKAPFDGEVLETSRHEAEWVNPGDLILKLARFDTLHVEAGVNSRYFDRSQVEGKKVTVEVRKAHGRLISVSGTIVYVNPDVQPDGTYKVRAEIENKREGNHWVIQPGLEATMVIHLN